MSEFVHACGGPWTKYIIWSRTNSELWTFDYKVYNLIPEMSMLSSLEIRYKELVSQSLFTYRTKTWVMTAENLHSLEKAELMTVRCVECPWRTESTVWICNRVVDRPEFFGPALSNVRPGQAYCNYSECRPDLAHSNFRPGPARCSSTVSCEKKEQIKLWNFFYIGKT